MGYQGARRTRPGAGAHRAPWRPEDDPDQPGQGTAPGPLLGPGTGGYQVLEPGGGTVTGPQRLPGSGSGPQPTLDRTPVRGFPPLAPGYQEAPTPPEGFGAWYTPGAPPAGQAPAGQGGGYAAGHDGRYAAGHDGGGVGVEDDEDDGPVPPALIAPGPGRRGRGGADRGGADRGRGGARDARTARPRRRSSRAVWLAAAAVLIVAGGGYAGYKYLYEPRVNAPVSSSLRLPTDTAASPGFDSALGKWQHIGTRAEDPEPLTLEELFPPQFELNGASYVRTAADVSEDCSLAVFGSNLQAALQAGHCTQVLRASYISGDGTMMGTIGVANLTSSSAAQKAGRTTGPQEIIAPLAAQKGPTSKLGNGTGVVQAEIKGHYLILMWAEFTSLKSPSTSAQRQQLEQFVTNLLTGSANIDLSTRMLTGKPQALPVAVRRWRVSAARAASPAGGG
jgi:hypothetical protein